MFGAVEGKKKSVKCLILSFILMALIPKFSLAQGLDKIPSFINSPYELSKWFLREFKYETEMPDQWQAAEETLTFKRGDCEDFAILSQAILTRLGIESNILIIKFRNLKQSHVVCIFKNGEFYNFMSNQKLIRTETTSIKDAIQGQYADWEEIIFTNPKKQCLKVIVKEKEKKSPEKHLPTALRNK